MTENGPRTADLEKRFTQRGIELEKRITALETKMGSIIAVGSLLGTIITAVLAALILGWIGQG